MHHSKNFILRPVFSISECCNKGQILYPLTQDHPSLLEHGFLSDTISRTICTSIRAYKNLLLMACIKTDWVSRGPGSSPFNRTVTFYGRTHHYLGAMLAPDNPSLYFLFNRTHDIDYIQQGNEREARMPILSVQPLHKFLCKCCLKSKLMSRTSWLLKVGQHQLIHPTLIA